MELFEVDSLQTQKTLIQLANLNSNDSIWINGRLDYYGVWSSFNPYKKAIFKGLTWIKEEKPSAYNWMKKEF